MTSEHARWILGGGLASGKSQVRKLLADAGVSTIDADSIGHEVLEPDGAAFREVAATWPQVVVTGRVDRAALAAIVFNDQSQLTRLEKVTHPHIGAEIVRLAGRRPLPVVVEVPILRLSFGDGWNRIVVDAIDETKLARAGARGMSRSDAEARIASQPSRAQWLATADLVIPNHGTLADLEEAVAQAIPYL